MWLVGMPDTWIWAVLTFGIALLYRFGPGRNDIPWHWISWGSATSAFVWMIASMVFSWYAASYGTFNKSYGSLGAGVGFMGAGLGTGLVENTGAFFSDVARTAALVDTAAAVTGATSGVGAAAGSVLLYALARISRSSKLTWPSPLRSP